MIRNRFILILLTLSVLTYGNISFAAIVRSYEIKWEHYGNWGNDDNVFAGYTFDVEEPDSETGALVNSYQVDVWFEPFCDKDGTHTNGDFNPGHEGFSIFVSFQPTPNN